MESEPLSAEGADVLATPFVPAPSRERRRPSPLRTNRPPLNLEQILLWVDDFHERAGEWPHKTSGPVSATVDETWCAINLALMRGGRGLAGGSSLAKLL